MLPPAQSSTLQALRVIIGGPGAGMFVYNGTPGPGNPPISWDSVSATDPYGNLITPALGLAGLPLLAYAGLASQVTQVLSGSGNFTVPAGVFSITPQLWGGGGNGAAGGPTLGGGGGGGGQFAQGTLSVTPAQVIAYAVGPQGVATTFGAFTAAPGGNATGVIGGTPGQGSTGSQIRHNGGAGANGLGPSGAGGGSSGGVLLAGNPGSGLSGGMAVTGGGAGGNGGGTPNPGSNGGGPGGGGGGGSAANHAAGSGAAGAAQVLYSTGSTLQLLATLSGGGGTDSFGNTYGAGLQIFQPGNNNALVVHGNNTAVLPQLLVLDFLGNTILGAGIQGVYGIGDPFICYSSFAALNPAELVAITPLADGLTGSHSGGLRTPGPAVSDLDSITPVAGQSYLNWQGLQDVWSGADMAAYLQVTATANGQFCTISLGQALVLGQNLVNGTAYTTLTLAFPANAAIANGTGLTLMNGSHGQNASQAITLSHAVAIGDTSIQVTSFMANFSYPGWTSGGNAPTTWMIVNAPSGTFPWNIEPVAPVLLNGQGETVHWHWPVRWWFQIGNAGLTIGALHAYAA